MGCNMAGPDDLSPIERALERLAYYLEDTGDTFIGLTVAGIVLAAWLAFLVYILVWIF